MENVNCFIAQAVVGQLVEQHWGHTALLSVDGQWQRARACSTGACGHREWSRESPARGEAAGAECALGRCLCCPAESSTEWGLTGGSEFSWGSWLWCTLWADCQWALGFSCCFCGDGNVPGSLINWGFSKKLLFQGLMFMVILPLESVW